MKRILSVLTIVCIIITSFLCNTGIAFAQSAAPHAGNIIITNNLTGKSDTIYIFGLDSGELVKIYSSETGSKILAYGTVPSGKSEITFNIPQLGTEAGSIFVSVIEKGNTESSRTKASYDGEPKSSPISADSIIITNNAQKSDTIQISGLDSKDLVKVYSDAKGGKLLGYKTVPASGSDITLNVNQIGIEAGYVYISVISKGQLESDRVKVAFDAEPKSTPLNPDDFIITNNAKKADTIYISNLNGGDVVKIYNAISGGKLLSSKTVSTNSYEATITLSQLGSSAGYIFATVTSAECAESIRVPVSYDGELPSDKPILEYITVTNNSGKSDTVNVSGLSAGDVIRVYNSTTKGTLLGSATVSASGNEVTVTISQLGTSGGSVYVSLTSSGKNESSRVQVNYSAESKSGIISSSNITITNNVGKADTVYGTGFSAGDIIKVYDSYTGGTLLGSTTVPSSATEFTIFISQLGTDSGTAYISVTSSGKLESVRIGVSYLGELKSSSLDANSISITNNVGSSDTIYVSGLTAGTVVKVYSAASSGYLLGSAVVATSKSDATVYIQQLGTAAGSVYISITQSGTQESSRTKADYSAEGSSTAPGVNNISITNNVGKADTVYISKLSAGDIVRIYNSASQGTLLSSGTVASSSTDVTVSIPQLGTAAGSIYVSVSSPGKAESSRTQADYKAESVFEGVDSKDITVTNNAGISDTVYFTRLTTGDVVKVYDSRMGGTLLGSAVVAPGLTDTTVYIAQLGKGAGSVFVTVSSSDKSESERVEVAYATEALTEPLTSDQIVVTNNIAGTADTIQVSGLKAGDVIKAYSSLSQGTLLGTASVGANSLSSTISVSQLSTASGSVYISVTNLGKLESVRTEAAYTAEKISNELVASNITVTNNAGIADTVKVVALAPGDTIKVYSTATSGILLGSATVSTSSTEATAEIAQLGSSEGTVYVSIISSNKAESSRTAVTYSAEAMSKAPDASKVSISNNYGVASTITVGGLKDNDVVYVYSAATGGTLLGKGTVPVYNSEVTIQVSQLNDTTGQVYISVAGTGLLESTRTEVTYGAKPSSTPPSDTNVIICNNVGFADTITVFGLDPNAIVKVYNQASGGNSIGSTTMPNDGSEATISITQLSTTAGSVYISVTAPGKTESKRSQIAYDAEAVSSPLEAGNVEVTNNSGMSDTIKITGLQEYDVIKIYTAASGGTKLATVTADTNTLTATANVSQLGTSSGSIYVTVTNWGRNESSRTKVQYEPESVAANASDIFIVNNVGMSDTITVYNLGENDTVKVYDAATNGNLVGSASVAPGSTKVTITVSQLTVAAGKVYISVTNYGRAESSLTKATYLSEQSTIAPYIGDIYIVNNVDIDDTVTVYNIVPGNVIKVYTTASGGTLLGYATVAANKTEATVTVDDLGSTAGTVYVSLIVKGKNESSRTEVSYVAESKSTAPYSGNIYVTNNVSISDTVLVTGLNVGDKIKVYSSASGGELLGSVTVATGSTQAKVSVKQLGIDAGSVFVSVTSKGKTESKRTEAEYVSEQTSNQPYVGYIKVVNNSTGTADTVTVSGLTAGDIVNVYSAENGGSLLGTATVPDAGTKATVSIAQLSTTSGSVYVTVTSDGKYESERTKADYTAQ